MSDTISNTDHNRNTGSEFRISSDDNDKEIEELKSLIKLNEETYMNNIKLAREEIKKLSDKSAEQKQSYEELNEK